MRDISVYRFKLSEMTPKRIKQGIINRVSDIPDSLAWKYGNFSKLNKGKLGLFENIHAGKRCFIMGNGPSLAKMDLTPLKDEYTFGLNRIYLLFDKLPFRPTYFVSVSDLVLEQFSDEIKQLSMPKFVNWKQRGIYEDCDNTYFLRVISSIKVFFEKSPIYPLESGSTVTNVAIQLAYYMGFSEVILIGVDHNFIDKGIPNSVENRAAESDLNHFHPDYFPKGVAWQLPDLLHSEMAYKEDRVFFENHGRKIVDATVNGKCEVFEKIDFHALFNK